MKKNFLIIISLLILFISLFNCKILYQEELELGGVKFNAYTFLYDEKDEISESIIIDDFIYILTKNNEVYKQHINSYKPILIGNIPKKDSTCHFENLIYCYKEDQINIYNYKLEEQANFKNLNSSTPIPYKDTYLKQESKNLNINSKKFRTLKEEYTIIDYYYNAKNTYILLENEDKTYLYNINNNSYEEVTNDYKKYISGFYFFEDQKIIIYDLNNDQKLEYERENIEYPDINILDQDNSTLYLITKDNNLNVLNLKNKTIKNITLPNVEITSINLYNNYLYSNCQEDLLLIDLNNLPKEELTIEEYTKKEDLAINNIIKNIKEKYKVNIFVKDESNINYPDFKAEILTDNNLIKNAINNIETILKKYNEEFFETFYESDYQGLNIYLTGKLTPKDYETQISNPAAYSLIYDSKYMIVIDINENNIKELICHELLHNIEFNLSIKEINYFPKWNTFNPENYNYNFSYTDKTDNAYTLEEENKEKVYFIDEYSKTYSEEDRSRIFEKICSCEQNSLVKDYPNLYMKGKYLKEELIEYYPLLKNSPVFNSLN